MDKDTFLVILQVIGPAILGLIAFLARDYVKSIQKEIHAVSKDVARLEGHLTYIHQQLQSTLTEVTKTSTELRAIWRFVDKHPVAMMGGEDA